jgi:hypothetical protein
MEQGLKVHSGRPSPQSVQGFFRDSTMRGSGQSAASRLRPRARDVLAPQIGKGCLSRVASRTARGAKDSLTHV